MTSLGMIVRYVPFLAMLGALGCGTHSKPEALRRRTIVNSARRLMLFEASLVRDHFFRNGIVASRMTRRHAPGRGAKGGRKWK